MHLGNMAQSGRCLRDEVVARLSVTPEVERIAETVVDAPVARRLVERTPAEVFVDAPKREAPSATYERRVPQAITRKINYLEREARNRSLGPSRRATALVMTSPPSTQTAASDSLK